VASALDTSLKQYSYFSNYYFHFPIIYHFLPWQHSIIPTLITPFMSSSGRKRLCACGCGKNVNRSTEIRHQQGKGPSTLASAILAQNWTLAGGHRKRKSSHQSVKNQLVGRRAPIRKVLSASRGLAGASGHGNNRFPDDDYPMDDAGPSGGHHDTPMPYSPPPTPNSPLPRLHSEEDVARNDVVSTLSKTRRSQRVAERVDQIGRQRWGTNHVQYFTDERGDDPAEEEVAEDDLVADGDEGNIYVDEEPSEDEDDIMAVAEPGQEGISVWDLLGESFLQEVSQIGMFSVERSRHLS
jgi:hypothetical protein